MEKQSRIRMVETKEKADAFIELLRNKGDHEVMAKLYDILHWDSLSDTQALARTELWQELESSIAKRK
jgi:hypothetical protein